MSETKPSPAMKDVVERLLRVAHRLTSADVAHLARGVEALGVEVEMAKLPPAPKGISRGLKWKRCGKCKRCREDPTFKGHGPYVIDQASKGSGEARKRPERSLGRLGRPRLHTAADADAHAGLQGLQDAPTGGPDGPPPARPRFDPRVLHDD